jgi:hypothetical protein
MPNQDAIVEMFEYQVILVRPDTRKVFVIDAFDGSRFPRVSVPQRTRPAQQLQKSIRAMWNLNVIFLDYLPQSEPSPFSIVAEVLSEGESSGLKPIGLDQVQHSELSDQQREQLATMLTEHSVAHSPFSQVGWIDEAIAWVEKETRRSITSKASIQQYNAGGAFSLVRFSMTGGRDYWLKATGKPNGHEMSITAHLSKLVTDYLPELVAVNPPWNAWLMSGEATPMTELPTEPQQLFKFLEDAVESMAELQMQAAGNGPDLLDAGAFDQGIAVFQKYSEALFDYIEEAMHLQVSTKAPRLEQRRLREIRATFDAVCDRMAELGLPETIVHGDLNRGNILTGVGHCQFIDWCEAYVGNPLVTLQHLLLLNKVKHREPREFINRHLKQKYRNVWAINHNPTLFDEGFVYMPILAIASTLYGRGDWLHSSQRDDPRRQSYARTLARCMDRAAREPALLEALCH